MTVRKLRFWHLHSEELPPKMFRWIPWMHLYFWYKKFTYRLVGKTYTHRIF